MSVHLLLWLLVDRVRCALTVYYECVWSGGGNPETCQAKLALLHVLQRVAWLSDSPQIVDAATQTLLAALRLSPRRTDAVQSFTALVSVLVDLLTADTHAKAPTKMIAEVCEQLVARVRFYMSHQVGVLQLLQSLHQLAEFAPEALWSSRFLFSCAHALVASCDSSVEKQLLLETLAPVLRFGRSRNASPVRTVYTESLVLPLLSVVSTHGEDASPLLQQVVELQAQGVYVPSPAWTTDDCVVLDEDSVHLDAFLRLVDDVERCSGRLTTLFPSVDATAVPKPKKLFGRDTANREEPWLSWLLGTLLFDERRELRERALDALERQAQRAPKFWSASTTKLLVSSLVFLSSQRTAKASGGTLARFADFVSRAFYVLATLAVTTTDTMKVVLRFIKRMNSVTSMQPTALRLLSVVWEQESRVYPRLEAMLYQDAPDSSSAEYELVKVATIEALCKKDPELGVEYISQIQAFLEDERASVAAMALNAIESLCQADCLDFYAVFKIVSLKIKKKKIRCIEAPLFIERLCVFYGLGTTELAANKRQAAKLLSHLWKLADNPTSTVRRCAYASLNCYSLLSLGLCVDESRSKAAGDGSDDDDDDDDEVTEDDVDEKLDELLESLETEVADDVRSEIEKLLSRVLEAESVKLNSGGGRGQANVSSTVTDPRLQQRVSAVATREAKKKFPSYLEVVEMCGAEKSGGDWDAILVAVEEKEPLEYSSVKRKDKLIKTATQNVVDMESILASAVTQQTLPWKAADDTRSAFLRVLSLIEAWQAFAYKYIEAVDELSSLKLTVGANPEDGDEFFAEHVSTQIAALDTCGTDGPENEQRVLTAVGSLIGRLRDCKRWASPQVLELVRVQREKIIGRLARAIEEAKVFPKEDHHFTVLSAVVGLHLSLGSRMVDAKHESATTAHWTRIEVVFAQLLQGPQRPLVRTVSSLAISHLGWLYSIDQVSGDLESIRARVQPITTSVLAMALSGVCTTEANARAISERVFSSEAIEEAQLPAFSGLQHADEVVVWGSLMGLARLSGGFASIRKLGWLENLKTLLNKAWRDEAHGTGVFGVALAPVLLECVASNLAPNAVIEHFLQTSLERLTSGTSERDEGFRLLTLQFLLCRASALGCTVRREQVREAIEQTRQRIEQSSGASSAAGELVVAGVANFFHHSLGICSLGDGPMRRRAVGSLELECDPSGVEFLAASVRLAATSGDGLARFVLGAIATTRELFFVAQTKKAFDAEVLTLPTKGMVFKALNTLRQEQKMGQHTQLVSSLLVCLASVGAHLPPLDYEAPVRRLIKRFCNPIVTVRCIQFALTRGICDVYAVENLYARTSLVNSDLRVQSELVAGLLPLAGRVDPAALQRLLTTVSSVVLNTWGQATCSTEALAVVETWIDVLGTLVLERDTDRRIASEARDVARSTVTQRVLPHLPAIDPSDRVRSTLVRKFAREVLARLPRHDGADDFVLRSSSESALSPLVGPQAAMILAELVRSGAVFAPEKQTAVVVQWVLRQDFAQWPKASAEERVQLLHELASFVLFSDPSGKQSHADIVSWIHELLDAFSRTLTVPSNNNDDVARRHALFVFLACVCVQKLSLIFERDADSSVVRVLPVALVRTFGRVDSILERLWQLYALVQRSELLKTEPVDYEGVLRAVILQTHVQSSAQPTPVRSKPAILRFWSVRGLQA